MHVAFYFGFEQQEYIYNEKHDVGPQNIPFSPAPGNRTEKNFTFALNLNAIQGEFIFGSMCMVQNLVYAVSKSDIFAANGDISFGLSTLIQPTFGFSARLIQFDVNFDNILESQEIGLLTIASSAAFDGFVPRFQSVRIIIDDSNS